MKRLNIILIAEENTNMAVEPYQQDVESQVNILNSIISANPSMAEDKDVVNLINLGEQIRQEEIKQGIVKIEPEETPIQPGTEPPATPATETVEESPLSSLPFFKEGKTTEKIDVSKLTVETLPDVAKNIGVDISKEGWVGEFIAKANPTPATSEFEAKYNELAESIGLLPKELQTAVNLHIDGKDWRSALSTGANIDLSKDFKDLSAEDKIKIHNYYFPDDTIASGEDLTKKDIAKSIRAAEAKYSADKFVASESATRVENERTQRQTNFLSSVDKSIAELKKEYPDFKEKDLKLAEELTKKGGIYSVFFDKNGNLKPDGFKKLIFAQHGENILKIATSIAENKGRNKGKTEVLSVEQGANKTPAGGGGTELTNAEKSLNTLVKGSMIQQNLTY